MVEKYGENGVIVFRDFSLPCKDDDGNDVIAEGFVFASPKLIRNISTLIRDSLQGITLNMDGTHKLTFNGWVLLLLTSSFVKRGKDKAEKEFAVHSTFPLLLCFTRSEAQPAFDATLHVLKRQSFILHDVNNLDVVSGKVKMIPCLNIH